MKYELFDYQRTAAMECLQRLDWGRTDTDRGQLTSFALSAITGSGKTVIATAVIEAMLHGSADLEVEADPRATFLWVTDDARKMPVKVSAKVAIGSIDSELIKYSGLNGGLSSKVK